MYICPRGVYSTHLTWFAGARSSDFGDCSCNLIPASCDPNCCCDPDCNEEDKMVGCATCFARFRLAILQCVLQASKNNPPHPLPLFLRGMLPFRMPCEDFSNLTFGKCTEK